jgi:hypothetical protein
MMALLPGMSSSRLSALAASNPRDFIVVELFFEETGDRPHQFKVPVGPNEKEAEPTGGGFTTVDDLSCKLTCDYELLATAFTTGQDMSRLSFKLSFNGKYHECGTEQIMTVARGRKSRRKLKCGVQVVAYYESASRDNH